jgi:hypothetical protein
MAARVPVPSEPYGGGKGQFLFIKRDTGQANAQMVATDVQKSVTMPYVREIMYSLTDQKDIN